MIGGNLVLENFHHLEKSRHFFPTKFFPDNILEQLFFICLLCFSLKL